MKFDSVKDYGYTLNSVEKYSSLMGTVPRPKGVYFNKNHQKWHVRVTISGRRRTVGYYDELTDAIVALERAKAGLF